MPARARRVSKDVLLTQWLTQLTWVFSSYAFHCLHGFSFSYVNCNDHGKWKGVQIYQASIFSILSLYPQQPVRDFGPFIDHYLEED